MSVNETFSFFIQWHLTERCILSCSHCYQSGAPPKEMTLPEVEGVMGHIGEMITSWSDAYGIDFSPCFNITGGKPFLRNDLFNIISAAKARGFAVYLLTNGTLIDEARARRLHGLGVDGVQVSLEGPHPVHDAIRGEGSFARSLAGVGHLVDARVPVTLNVTLSRVNHSCFSDLIGIGRDLKVQRLGFSRLVPSGRGLGLIDSMLTGDEVKALYEDIFARETPELEFVTGDPVASSMRDPSQDSGPPDVARGGCAAGVSGLTLLPDGTVTPCRRLNIPVGNVLTDSLREIWATSEVLRNLRTKEAYTGKCGSCERWASCRGCRAIAYAYALSQDRKDYLGDDPQCFLGSPLGPTP